MLLQKKIDYGEKEGYVYTPYKDIYLMYVQMWSPETLKRCLQTKIAFFTAQLSPNGGHSVMVDIALKVDHSTEAPRLIISKRRRHAMLHGFEKVP